MGWLIAVLGLGTVGSLSSNIIRNVFLFYLLTLLPPEFSLFLDSWAGKIAISSPRYIF